MTQTRIETHGTYDIIRIDTSAGRFYGISGTSWTFTRLANARRRAKALAKRQGA